MSKETLYKIGDLHITAPADWLDVTREIDDDNPPFTLGRLNGIGVIQFSIADYRSGKIPGITLDDLGNFLVDFAQSRELGPGYDLASQENSLLICAASFDFEDRFLRVWYCSNGQSMTLVTYNCQNGDQQAELPDCESIVRKLKFVS